MDLLLGRIEYSVTLSAAELERAFAQRGIQATCAGRNQWDEHFLAARRGAHHVVVPTHTRQQMLSELMTSATLIDVVELMLDALDAGAPLDDQHVLCCDEAGPAPG